MGIDTRFITMYGVCVKSNDDLFEVIESYYKKGLDNFYHFVDMDCTKFVLGHTFLKTDSIRWEIPFGHEEISLDSLDKIKQDAIEKIRQIIGTKLDRYIEKEWKIISFVQTS